MRVIYFGAGNRLSYYALDQLLRRRVDVCAVLMSGYGPAALAPGLPVRVPAGSCVDALAERHDIPLQYIAPRGGSAVGLAAMHRYRPHIGLSVCHPHRIAAAVRASATVDFLNLHPSLLPAYRGPAPFFWQLRLAERRTGVSLHRLTDALDAGPVVAQCAVTVPDGARADEIKCTLAAHGAALFAALLARYRDDEVSEWPQDESEASYYPAPGARDLIVPVTWCARRAFNFLRGAGSERALTIHLDRIRLEVDSAVGFTRRSFQDQPFRLDGRYARVRFNPGSVLVRYRRLIEV